VSALRSNRLIADGTGSNPQPAVGGAPHVDPSRQTGEFVADVKAAKVHPGCHQVLDEAADVRAYAAGRANARMSPGAAWIIGIIAAVVLAALVLLHTVVLPGVLLIYVVYDAMNRGGALP
jgi:hypothetical protein